MAMVPRFKIKYSATDKIIITGQFYLIKSLSIAKGDIIAAMPSTKPMFAMLEPITFPKQYPKSH